MQLRRAARLSSDGDDVPRGLLDVGVLERGVLGHGVLDVQLVLGEIHVGEASSASAAPRCDPSNPLGAAPRRRRRTSTSGRRSPTGRASARTRGSCAGTPVILLGAVAHHPLDVRAWLYQLRSKRTISPAAGRCSTYRWKYHWVCSPLRRLRQGDDPDRARAGALGDPLDHAALPGRAATLEDHQDPEALTLDPVLQQHQLFLQPLHLPVIDAALQPALGRVVVRAALAGGRGRVVRPGRGCGRCHVTTVPLVGR